MRLKKLATEAAEEYFGYRVIYDLDEFTNGFDMAAGMPPKYLKLLLSGEEGAKMAMSMHETIKPACLNLIEMLRIELTGDVWKQYGTRLEAIVKPVLATRNPEGQRLLMPFINELYESALWGVLLGMTDSERIGEKPPVALGTPFEAQKYVIDLDTELTDPVLKLVRSTKIMCVRHGFFTLRAGYIPLA